MGSLKKEEGGGRDVRGKSLWPDVFLAIDEHCGRWVWTGDWVGLRSGAEALIGVFGYERTRTNPC